MEILLEIIFRYSFEYSLQKIQKDNRTPVIIFRKSRIFKTFPKIWSLLLKWSLVIKNWP